MKAISFLSVLFFLISCSSETSLKTPVNIEPVVENGGETITFSDEKQIRFFSTINVHLGELKGDLIVPGKIAATVLNLNDESHQNLIIFDDPALSSNYTQLIQHEINANQIRNVVIKQRELELERISDLKKHGAASGQELLSAQTALSMEKTNLANEMAAKIEHETMLIAAGFDPVALKKANPNVAFLICEIPENQILNIVTGSSCSIKMSAFPNETFSGKVEAIAELVDNTSRMIKIRISLPNPTNRFKSGMFSSISFYMKSAKNISIPTSTLISVQGKNYVFVKKGDNRFVRKEVKIGQQIGENVIVLDGLSASEEIAYSGVIQLKGLSFGY